MKNHSRILKRVFEIIEPAKGSDVQSKIFDISIIALIIINVSSVVLESFEVLSIAFSKAFGLIEAISIGIFSIEYFLRLATASLRFPERTIIHSYLRFIRSPMAIIDLMAILPFYIPFLIPVDLRFLRILRLTRILRVLKINRYSSSMRLLGRVLLRTKEKILVTLFVTFLLLLLSASLMYYIENDSQPESFPNIIASFWWAIATLTTVGYGDVYPITWLGKILAGIIALLGIGVVALPAGIISSGFIQEYEDQKINMVSRRRKSSLMRSRYKQIAKLKRSHRRRTTRQKSIK